MKLNYRVWRVLNDKQKPPELEFKKYSVVYEQTLLQSLVKVGRGREVRGWWLVVKV